MVGTDIVAAEVHLPAVPEAELDLAADYARSEKAAATRRAYQSDFAIFGVWCAERGLSALPAKSESVAAFLAGEAKRGTKASTIGRRVAAIRYAHKLAGHPLPTDDERVRATVRGIRRTIGTAPVKKQPALAERIVHMAQTGDGLIAVRDRALLLLGFAMAARRSELSALQVADIADDPAGLLITIRGGKTDQERKGTTVAVVRGEVACPVQALKGWLLAAGITEGPVFRPINRHGQIGSAALSGISIGQIVQRHAERIGLDPNAYGAHSLRAGFVTSAAKRGANVFKLMEHARHKSMNTTKGYVRDAELFKDHAGAGLL
jgi:site-specific recombinase XerD